MILKFKFCFFIYKNVVLGNPVYFQVYNEKQVVTSDEYPRVENYTKGVNFLELKGPSQIEMTAVLE